MYLKPSYFIIGERKCGTSSLYRYLIQHPTVLPCQLKEPNFFVQGKNHVERHIKNYWKMFPPQNYRGDISFIWPELNKAGILYHEKVSIDRIEGIKYITGEASANTFYEADPELVHRFLPDLKLILLFRNPVERAFSHHRMYERFQKEGRPLEFKVNDFELDVRKEMKTIKQDGWGEFLSPGIYLRKLKKWKAYYPSEQIKIVFSKQLKESPAATMKVVLEYLNLPAFDYGSFLNHHFNKAPDAKMSEELYKELSSFFEPYNKELEDFLDRKLIW